MLTFTGHRIHQHKSCFSTPVCSIILNPCSRAGSNPWHQMFWHITHTNLQQGGDSSLQGSLPAFTMLLFLPLVVQGRKNYSIFISIYYEAFTWRINRRKINWDTLQHECNLIEILNASWKCLRRMLKTEQRYHLYVNGSQCFSIKARVTAKVPLLKMEERFTNFYSTLDK